MATYTVGAGKLAVHAKTTAADVEDIVNFADDIPTVEVLVESGGDAYFTIDRSAATVAGDNTYFVKAGSAVQVPVWTAGASQIRLISSGAALYHVNRS